MRLVEACFSLDLRSKFVTKNDSLDRKGLDARSSPFKADDFWSLACERFNDEKWIPTSRCLPDLYSHLRNEIQLQLEGEKIIVEQFKRWYKNVRAKVTVALSNWRTSGNGSGNHTVPPRVKGIFYENECGDDVEFVDDDRIKFAKSIEVGYFWAIAECAGLMTEVWFRHGE